MFSLIKRPFLQLLFLAMMLVIVDNVYSQDSTLFETTQLDEVVIYGLKSMEFIEGSNQRHFDSVLRDNPADNIGNLLQRYSPVYIKEYGNQMLATISLRGTGAGHTATLWNGININSPTLGQFDFSQAPSIVTDKLLLHYGGSSSLFGNESIGGNIVLQSHSMWEDHPSTLLYQDFGSYGSFNTRASFRMNTDKFESATKVYFSTSKNNFPYTNLLMPDTPTENQKNAESEQEGFAQDFYWRPKSRMQISLNTWYHHSSRQLQPSMALPDSEETQEDRNLRLRAAWAASGEAGYVNASLGYINDYMLFNGSIATESDQFILKSDLGKDITETLSANLGSSLIHIIVQTDNYSEDRSEDRWDIYGWLKYHPNMVWSLSANIRSSGASGFTVPLAPSLGSDLVLKQSAKTKIIWKALGSISYRIPTLNDRYWNPGGNQDLKSESSTSIETGFQFQQNNATSIFNANITVYRMWVDNWIIWLPQGSFWSPENLREVISTGIEISGEGNYQIGKTNAKWNASYTYTKSTNQTQLDSYDRSKGKQLPYIPFHNISLCGKVKRLSWYTEIAANYTGKRYTSTDNADGLDDFWLMDLALGNTMKYVSLEFHVLNLLNTTYFHLPYRPMPGRNYKVSITLRI